MVYAFCSKERADYLLYVGNVADRIFYRLCFRTGSRGVDFRLLYFIGMLLCGFPYAFTISVLVAVLGLIPLIGTFISFIIGCFLILVAAPAKIWLFCLFFSYSNVLKEICYIRKLSARRLAYLSYGY